MSDRMDRTKRMLMEKFNFTESEAEGWINQHKDEIDEMNDSSFDLWLWASLIFGVLSLLSFLIRLFSGSRSKKERAREEECEELIV